MYGLFGSSRQLQVGPVALISLLTANALNDVGIVNPDTQPALYAEHAFFLAFSTGIVTMAAGLVRMGFILNFISDAVVLGFISSTALIIMCQQLKNIFQWPNYKFPRRFVFFLSLSFCYHTLQSALHFHSFLPHHLSLFFYCNSELLQDNIKYFIQGCQSGPPNWAAFTIFLLNFIVLLSIKFIAKYVYKPKNVVTFVRFLKYFAPLLCVIFSTLIVGVAHLNSKYKVAIVGKVPGGKLQIEKLIYFLQTRRAH